MAKSDKLDRKTKVTRISASDNSVKAKPARDSSRQTKTVQAKSVANRRFKNPLKPILGYVKGAWYELRQVRWPDRRSTWGMTGALIAFTLFFLVVIILLDVGFQKLFNLIIGK